MSNLLKQLKSLKHDARFGGMDQAAKTASWERIAAAIGTPETTEPKLVPAGQSYGAWVLSQYISRPVLAGAFSVAVIAGGWMTTVRASDSLPGEALYSVKMITEKAQLKLASMDRKAVLHTQFAERRLQEVSDLQDASTDNAALVRGALEAYRHEVSSAGENLRQLKDAGGPTALATATSVQQNLLAIDNTIDGVVAESGSAEATQDALAAKEITKEVSDVATTVAVEVHEEEQSEVSTHELKEMFKRKLGEIETRQRFDLERLRVIEMSLADESISYENFTIPNSDELLAYDYILVAVDSKLSQAMNSFAAGGYRDAFTRLQELDSSLLMTEASFAQIENTIMNARQQSQLPEAEVEPAEATETAETEVSETL